VTAHIDQPTAARPHQRAGDPERLDLPFGWVHHRGAPHPPPVEREARFRFPAADDPAPPARRLLAMSGYAALLGLAGVGVGLRGLLSVIAGVPDWYVPVLALAALVAVALTVGSFLSVHRRWLPWALLLAAAVPLTGAVVLTATY
jgi:hypothetical protein